jgi:hypothetical protein
LDAMRVPTYAKYLKDILNNKRPLPDTEKVTLAEECSSAILNKFPHKMGDPGIPTISCLIGTQKFDHALCDLGASVSVMPKVIYDQLEHGILVPTSMHLQLADQSIRRPVGIAEDIPVKIRESFVPVDFVVLEMEVCPQTPLILGRPFLSTAGAHIDVSAGIVRLNISGKEEIFHFKPKKTDHANQVNTLPRKDNNKVELVKALKHQTLPAPKILGNKDHSGEQQSPSVMRWVKKETPVKKPSKGSRPKPAA